MTFLTRRFFQITVSARTSTSTAARMSTARTIHAQRTPLVLSPQEVNTLNHSPTTPITFLDATWFMPNVARDPKQEFLQKRIPGAHRLDLDETASPNDLGLKHMMPSSERFAQECRDLGITPDSHVVIYDSHGIFSSPRALFMFRAFNHEKSSILNGGLPRWIDEGLPVSTDSTYAPPEQAEYPRPKFRQDTVRHYLDMVINSTFDPKTVQDAELVLDARPRGRWLGADPEPRPGLSSGHIPNSISLPFTTFLQKHTAKNGSGEYTTILSPAEIRAALEDAVGAREVEAIVHGDRSVVTSCGSGMTAGVLWLGLQLIGARRTALYDESWTGYAMRPESNIVRE